MKQPIRKVDTNKPQMFNSLKQISYVNPSVSSCVKINSDSKVDLFMTPYNNKLHIDKHMMFDQESDSEIDSNEGHE